MDFLNQSKVFRLLGKHIFQLCFTVFTIKLVLRTNTMSLHFLFCILFNCSIDQILTENYKNQFFKYHLTIQEQQTADRDYPTLKCLLYQRVSKGDDRS